MAGNTLFAGAVAPGPLDWSFFEQYDKLIAAYESSMSGFSLLELCLVLCLLAAFSLLAYPTWQQQLRHYRRQQILSDLVHIIHYATAQALLRDQSLMLRPLYQQNWSQGVTLVAPPHQVLWTLQPLHRGYHLSFRAFGHPKALQFNPSGLMHTFNGTFTLSLPNKEKWQVILSRAGRTRVVGPLKHAL